MVIDLAALQAAVELESRECLAAGLLHDRERGVFVHRRAQDRKLLPGLWDIPWTNDSAAHLHEVPTNELLDRFDSAVYSLSNFGEFTE